MISAILAVGPRTTLNITVVLPSGTAARLLQRLEGGAAAHPAAAAPAAPAVDDAARQRSRAHLQKVLAGNAKLRLAPHQAAAAAQVCALYHHHQTAAAAMSMLHIRLAAGKQ